MSSQLDDLSEYIDDLQEWLDGWDDYYEQLQDAMDYDGMDCDDYDDYLSDVQDWLEDWHDYMDGLKDELETLNIDEWEDGQTSDFQPGTHITDGSRDDLMDGFVDAFLEYLMDFLDEEELIKFCKTGELPADISNRIKELMDNFNEREYGYDGQMLDYIEEFWDRVEELEGCEDEPGSKSGPGISKLNSGSLSGSFKIAQNLLQINNALLQTYESAGSAANRQYELLKKIF